MSYFATPPLPIIDVPADARHQSGPGLNARVITIHATGGTNSLEWLTTNPASDVSTQRLINKAGAIYKLVPDDCIAHHVGKSRVGNKLNLNSIALGIELENLNNGRDPFPPAQVRACALQVIEWWGLFGFLPLLSHALIDTTGKTDPAGFPWPLFYRILTEELGKVLAAATYPPDLVAATQRAAGLAHQLQAELGVIAATVAIGGAR